MSRLRRRSWRLALVAPALFPLLGFLGDAHRGGPPVFSVLGVVVALFVLVLVGMERHQRQTDRRAEPGALRVEHDGAVTWNGTTVAAPGQVREGLVLPGTPHGDVARLVVQRGRAREVLEFGVASADEGRALLRALGVDAAQSTATVRARSRVFAVRPGKDTPGWMVLLWLLASAVAFQGLKRLVPALDGGALVWGVMLLLGAWQVISGRPATITVGTDGVLIRWLGTRRFVPYRDIERVQVGLDSVGVVCRDGSELTLPVGSGERPDSRRPGSAARVQQAQAERAALAERIREAMAAVSPERAPAFDRAALARGERPVREWLAALRALAQRADGGMRTAPVTREALLACAADARATPDERAAAAVALAAMADDAQRSRLRVVAQTVASPQLRVALEAAADGGDDAGALEAALERLAARDRA